MPENPQADLSLLLAVFLPPAALDMFGPLVAERMLETPFGPVGPVGLRARAEGPAIWVQPYSGSPVRTDPRAAIHAALQLGVRQILAWDACVSLTPTLQRGQIAIVSDYIDWTRHLPHTFVSAVAPMERASLPTQRPSVCPRLSAALRQTMPDAVEAVYLGVDGPRRETAAEARMFAQWGADVAGQNLVPEAALAQEAGLCFAGLVTVSEVGADRAQPHPQGEVRAALGAALAALPKFLDLVSPPGECGCAAARIG